MKAFTALFLLVAFAVSVYAVTDLEFALDMKGKCDLKADTCFAKGNSQTVKTHITPNDAVEYEVKEIIGSYARIHLSASPITNSTFTEVGNITFGGYSLLLTLSLLSG